MIKAKNEIIEINEKFTSVGVKSLDSKSRIILGDKIKKILLKKIKVDAFEVLVGEQGDVLLRPVANIPSKEAWLHQNPKALRQVIRGLTQANRGDLKKVVDLNQFINDL